MLLQDGNAEAVALLLEHRAAVETVGVIDCKGRTALHLAAAEGNAEAVALLLEHGAAVGVADSDRRTALHLAAREENVQAVALLLEHRVDVGVIDCPDGCPVLKKQGNAPQVSL